MKDKKANSIEIPAAEESFEQMRRFFREYLEEEKVSKEGILETMLVMEALFHNLLEQGIGADTLLTLSRKKSLGNIMIQIGFEGKIAYLFTEETSGKTPENSILHAYEERIDSSYNAGYNSFQITVKRKHMLSLLYCLIGLLCAVLVWIPLHSLMELGDQLQLIHYYLMPMEAFFGNLLLMIGAPVTFFSLLKNLTTIQIMSNRSSDVRKLRVKTMARSVLAILLSIAISYPFFSLFFTAAAPAEETANVFSKLFASFISEAVPPSIFEPFESASPIPLIVVSLVVTTAFCLTGRYLPKLKKAVDICYTVFSKMLGVVMYLFPFFFFVTALHLMIENTFDIVSTLLFGALLIFAATLIFIVFLFLRLRAGGVPLRPFLKKLMPLLMENCMINSSIDSVPFNIRYCARHYGMNRKRLEEILPVLAQIDFIGNTFILMSIALFMGFWSGISLEWYYILIWAILVFFLSLGAPNQPGSILIGTIIILQYQGMSGNAFLFVPIVLEAALGMIMNLVNVLGDIITAAVEEKKHSVPKNQNASV